MGDDPAAGIEAALLALASPWDRPLAGACEAGACASALLDRLEAAVFGAPSREASVAVAVACAPPLAAMLTREDIGLEDFQRGCLVLGAICKLDRSVITRIDTFGPIFAPRFGLAALQKKEPEQLGLDVAYTAACAACCLPAMWSFGCTSIMETEGSFFSSSKEIMVDRFAAVYSLDSFKNEVAAIKLLATMLEVLRDQPEMRPPRHADVFEASAWYWFCALSIGRPAAGRELVAAGLMEFGVAQLEERWTPIERVGQQHNTPGAIVAALKDVYEVLSLGPTGGKMLEHIIDTGVVEKVVCNIRTYEALGKSAVKLASVMANWYGCWWFLTSIDMLAPAAQPVVTMLRGVPSSVRFALDHPLVQMGEFELGTRSQGTMVAACVFGRDEDCEFVFTQDDVDKVVLVSIEQLRPTTWGGVWPVLCHQSQTLFCLSVSDRNKQLLLNNESLMAHLVDGLLLDSAGDLVTERGWNPITDVETVKCRVQHTFAQCLQQLSLFEPGRHAMLQDKAVVKALRKLTTHGWTSEAKLSAHGALLALMDQQEGGRGAVAAARIGDGFDSSDIAVIPEPHHVMLSYEWSCQEVVKRIVAQLTARSYKVWLDIKNMKGSTIDAMSEAIDNADVMLFGVSLKYKESANCRLEATYAMQVPRLPASASIVCVLTIVTNNSPPCYADKDGGDDPTDG